MAQPGQTQGSEQPAGAEATQQQNGQPPAQTDGRQPQQPPSMATAEELLAADDEEDALADLTHVGSILAAFQLEEEIYPWLAALSESLDDVDVDTLISQTTAISHDLHTGLRNINDQAAPPQENGHRNRQTALTTP